MNGRQSDAVPRCGKTRYRHWASNLDLENLMGRRNFHGTVKTLADAVEADYLIFVVCEMCSRRRQMHPYKITSKYSQFLAATFGPVFDGFHCNGCKQNVSVTFVCTHRRPGEF
jgi:hypothetical protein